MSKQKKEDEEPQEATATGGEGEGAEESPKKGKKKLVIIAAVVLVLAIGAGLFLSGVLGGGAKEGDHVEAAAEEGGHGEKKGEHGEAAAVAAGPVYYELPQFLVNLNAANGRTSFIKMAVTLELRDQAAVATMDANKPRVMDTFNTYLRELRPADIQGSAGIYRLRNELMARLNSTVEEGIAKDILFGEIVVQ